MAVEAWVEHQLEGAASQIAGGPVQVHCQSLGQAFVDLGPELGYVAWGPDGVPERSTLIKFGACGNLRAWLGSTKANPSLDQVIAVHVVTHETMHMVGLIERGPRRVRGRAAGRRDGRGARARRPHEAQALALRYWTEVYPRMPDGYVGGCGPGGDVRRAARPTRPGSRAADARVAWAGGVRPPEPVPKEAVVCRWLAYTGSPVLIDDLLYKPTNSLVVQSLHSRLGAEATNGDGVGVGWYTERLPDPRGVPQHRAGLERPEPARAGRARPLRHGPRAHPRHRPAPPCSRPTATRSGTVAGSGCTTVCSPGSPP